MKQKEGAVEYLVPSTLGIGLVKAYDRVGLENSLTKPHLRRLVSLQISYEFDVRKLTQFPMNRLNKEWFKFAKEPRRNKLLSLKRSKSTEKSTFELDNRWCLS